MLPTPETTVWLSRIRLMPEALRRTRRTNSASSNPGSRGSRAMWVSSAGSAAPAGENDRPPNIRWSTNLRSTGPSCPVAPSRNRTRRCRSAGASAGCTSSWPLMPRCPRRASPESSGSQRYLPRRRAAVKTRPVSRAAKSSAPGRCRRTGRGCSTSTDSIVRSSTCASRPRRTTSTSGSSGTGGGRRALGPGGLRELVGERAVRRLRRLLLGLLLRPADAVAVQSVGDPHLGGEGLHVVRTGVLDDVLRHAEIVLGTELLEAGLPVQAGAEGGSRLEQRVEQQVDQRPGVVEPARGAAGEVGRPDQRLDRVGEDRGLVVTARRLLALAQADVRAETDRARHLGEGACVDHGGPQLGEPTLGELRVAGVEGLGDDDAEDRVAEELEALVGGQATVLVGVGAMRERKLQQLGIQLGITERGPQVPEWIRVVRLVRHDCVGGRRQMTWRRSARAPYWPHSAQARCGRCLAPHAGLLQVTSEGATAFHCERRWRVLLRDIFRFGTATMYSLSGPAGQVDLVGATSRCYFSGSACGPVRSARAAHRGSTGSSCRWSGSSARRAPHSTHSPGQSSWHNGWNGSASTTASRSAGSRSSRSSSSRLTSSSSSSLPAGS